METLLLTVTEQRTFFQEECFPVQPMMLQFSGTQEYQAREAMSHIGQLMHQDYGCCPELISQFLTLF
jgi:hypothetical protein